MTEKATALVAFRPRRLGHANLYVKDLEASMRFYNTVVGLEEVYREPEVTAGFLSNGNTHHDIGLMQATVAAGGSHVTTSGRTVKIVPRGLTPGLNHLGWEMNNKDELIEAWRRAKAAGNVRMPRTVNHQITHSVYVEDPDGNQHEFYADQLEDWRTVFRPDHDDLLTHHWDPSGEPGNDRQYWQEPTEFRSVPGAVFHPRAITHVGIVARDFAAMRRFFLDVAGLEVDESTTASDDAVLLKGQSRFSVTLFAPRQGREPGLRYIAFALQDAAGLEGARERAAAGGIATSNVSAQALRVVDPDGLDVLFYAGLSPRELVELGCTVIDHA